MPHDRAAPPHMQIVGIHRRRLHAVLLRAVEAAGVELLTGATVTGVNAGAPGGEPATVTWRSDVGEGSRECGLVVAADGVDSTLRQALFPGERAPYGGSTSWRAVIPDTDFEGRLIEVWGPGTEFGALRVGADHVYWYGEFVHPEGAAFADELVAARRHFAGWAGRVRALVAATEPGQLIRHDVYHLPRGCPRYVHGRVVLVGDAAHAMLPTVGQGAASALEDAVCVGRLIGGPLRAGRDLATVMAHFAGRGARDAGDCPGKRCSWRVSGSSWAPACVRRCVTA